MPSRCANPSCSVPSTSSEGKLFRLDIDLGDTLGRNSTKTSYIWLCSRCSSLMIPTVQVSDDAVRLRLELRDLNGLNVSALRVA